MTAQITKPGRVELSVVIASKGREDFLREAVSSALRQDLPQQLFEVIVISDIDAPWLAELDRGGEIRFIQSSTPVGQALAQGIELARGEIIVFLDDDDRLSKSKLVEVWKAFQNPRVSYFHNGHVTISEDGGVLEPGRTNSSKVSMLEALAKPAKQWQVRNLAGFNLSSIAVRKAAVLPLLSTLKQLRILQDSFIYYTFLINGDLALLTPEPLTEYRVHNSMSNYFGDMESYFVFCEGVHLRYADACRSIRQLNSDSRAGDLLEHDYQNQLLWSLIFGLRVSRRLLAQTLLVYLRHWRVAGAARALYLSATSLAILLSRPLGHRLLYATRKILISNRLSPSRIH